MIVRFNPWYDYNENVGDFFGLRRRFDNLLNDFFNPEREYAKSNFPQVDIIEDSNNIKLYSELPGFKKEDIKITVKDDIIKISGTRDLPETPEKVNWLRHERFHGDFSRSFMLPFGVDSEKVKADFKDGVLNIVLPKKEEAKVKEIAVK